MISKIDAYTVKKVNDFPVPSRDVTEQTLPGRNFYYSRAGRVWLVTSRLGTGISLTFFYSVPPPAAGLTGLCMKSRHGRSVKNRFKMKHSEEFNYSPPGRVWSAISRLGRGISLSGISLSGISLTGISLTCFYSALYRQGHVIHSQ
jgi:hypothetical protein